MSLTVYRSAEDGLSRQFWTFSASANYSSKVALTLVSYGIERRKQPKGRWCKALPPDRWSRDDERRYHSGQPRPTNIPTDVTRDALIGLEIDFYIGWPTPEHKFARNA